MKCPYCTAEMVRGYIYGDRYKLKWLPEEKSLLLGLWAIGSIKLGEFAGFGRPKVGANMCQACRKFIIDM
ncbi:MAG: hypothetical protein A2509_09820 [Candidatus Edwardsbacteria bacterium RIFOXYD12_FULL_50_11]|uniref:DUF6487 domain-containing protein n=1 Tax=Candidatus Edwardsbacteria bacterium GWF2_54_11 TaxID=1817851 RepID=A0A1F5RBY5_9BACT|nr:MAG: hypothetical protein A2502_08050 [Candidatus Edwardsbacteria bacterium RifOxyC12_full_54_24]OGF07453.1 MAG: hypothetical protein A2273_03005 [Candidatus Edwardsbacteria bacterium RifOxyA12_full_54_48]OGF09703.1 MAG: hypothetical protein A3K15_09415 [Candidatus Edwardsbacteria bacterium GWE2_54_12]OGF11966.1 MAG: hypothetical protein A2024_02970 [Candidatus Edwardsbacteria bacterium GWF2_54_11]OGF18148.1 MAG: hypothetical protein A2509_09820 [Candidatus Edwardsbacteria bacterium RIFOXYD1